MSQCHRYTAAPASALQPFLLSTTVRLIVSGTPVATPLAVPKLERMLLRTTPLCVSTLGPFVPSPGYGPAVSSGILEQLVTAVLDAAVVDVAPAVVFAAVAAVVADVAAVDGVAAPV